MREGGQKIIPPSRPQSLRSPAVMYVLGCLFPNPHSTIKASPPPHQV